MYIGKREISPTAEQPFIIAELGSTHEGQVDRAKKLTEAAAVAGADAVKFQIWQREHVCTPDYPHYQTFGELEFSIQQWHGILSFARSTGLIILADVDDEESTDLALEGGVAGLKIRSTNLSYPVLLQKVAATGKPIIVSNGASTTSEIANALSVLEEAGATDILLIHGFQAFPTSIKDTHLRSIGFLAEHFGKLVGYADHADGDSPMAFILPSAALAAGACVIEKHLSIDRELHTEDWESSLNPNEFARLVKQLRLVWQSLGRGEHDLTEAEQNYRTRFKRSIVAARDIARKQRIEPDDLTFKIAANTGLAPNQVDRLIGKRAAADIPANALLSEQMLQ